MLRKEKEMLEISENAKKAINMLNSAGYEAYVVGGCVRDMVMGNPASDFDITTSALPEETKEVFKSERIIETGLKHGTVTVLFDGEPLEITTYRIDGDYLDNRHPQSVSFTKNLENDLSRRDFTMNALVYNETDGVRDCFGGIPDIENKIIRAIGDPKKRFCEDALRILRGIRFAATLGFEIEENTKRAMLECKHLLHNISPERISVEINKLLLGKNVKNVILDNYEILGELCPEFIKMKGFNQQNRHHIYDVLEHTAVSVENVPAELRLRLAMLFHDTGKVHTFTTDERGEGHFYSHAQKSTDIARDYLNKYRYDNQTKDAVLSLVKHHDMVTELDEVLIKKRLNRMGKDAFLDLIKIQRADNSAQSPVFDRSAYFDTLEKMTKEIIAQSCFGLSSLAVNGRDMLALGFLGKAIGDTLNALLNEVMENKLPNEREALLKRAEEYK